MDAVKRAKRRKPPKAGHDPVTGQWLPGNRSTGKPFGSTDRRCSTYAESLDIGCPPDKFVEVIERAVEHALSNDGYLAVHARMWLSRTLGIDRIRLVLDREPAPNAETAYFSLGTLTDTEREEWNRLSRKVLVLPPPNGGSTQ